MQYNKASLVKCLFEILDTSTIPRILSASIHVVSMLYSFHKVTNIWLLRIYIGHHTSIAMYALYDSSSGWNMMTSSNENLFHVTGHLCGESTSHRWIPLTKASDAELWCFVWSAPWINGWVNNREAGDLRRHRAHYDVIVMKGELIVLYSHIKISQQYIYVIHTILFILKHIIYTSVLKSIYFFAVDNEHTYKLRLHHKHNVADPEAREIQTRKIRT